MRIDDFDILISSRSWGLESLEHGIIWLWSSTRKHYNLKIEVDISDCAPRLEPEMIYVQTCKRSKSFRPHVKWLPKVTESEEYFWLVFSMVKCGKNVGKYTVPTWIWMLWVTQKKTDPNRRLHPVVQRLHEFDHPRRSTTPMGIRGGDLGASVMEKLEIA